MKKFSLLTIVAVLLTMSYTHAQVSSYTFSSAAGTYTPITGGTAIRYNNAVTNASVTTATLDDDVYYNRPIGFNFTYNGVVYTTFGFNANGWLIMGSSTSFSSTSTPISTTTTANSNLISAGAVDWIGGIQLVGTVVSGNNYITVNSSSPTTGINVGDTITGTGIPSPGAAVTAVTGTTVTIDKNTTSGSTSANWRVKNGEIRYETIGNSPNRTLVLQFTSFGRYSSSAPGDRANFQIRLNETTNTVQIVYSGWSATYTGTSLTLQTGLKGATSTDYNNRTTTTNWSASTAGTTNTAAMTYTSTVVPADGLTYTWTPPACVAPSSVSAGSITANSASISFSGTGNSFVVEYGATGFTPGTGATAGTGGTVITGTASPITISGLSVSTTYQVYVRQNCTGSGNGYSANSTVASFTTAAACTTPTAVSISGTTTNSASVNFTSSGSSFIVEYGAAGFTPGTGATAGTGGTVVTGTASPITINGLTSGTTYDVYVRQNCSSAGNGYSANTAKVTFSTNCTAGTVPYSENFDGVTAPALPPCIVIEDVNGGTTWSNTATTITGMSAPNMMRYTYNTSTVADDWFFVKGLNLTAGTNYLLTFKYANNSSTYIEKLEVKVGTAATAASASAGTQVFNNANITGSVVSNGSGIFTPATTGTYYFGFHAYSAINQFYLYVDDIKVDVAPACPSPTAASIGSIAATSAAVNFTSSGNSFIAEYSTTRFTPGTGATAGTGGTVITGTSSPISLTGLTPGTKYYVYLRQNCSAAGNGYSTNVFVDSFTTTALAPTACATNSYPANGATGITPPINFSWSAVPGATSYTLYISTTNPPVDSITTTTTNSVVIVGGTPNTTYYWYVVPKNSGGAATSCSANTTSYTTGSAAANDACTNAVNLTVSNGFCSTPVLGTLAFADSTAGLGTASCSSGALKYDVWYKATVPASGKMTVQTSAVNTTVNDLVLQAYSGDCRSLVTIDCDDDGNPDTGPSGLHSKLGLTGRTPGEVIYFRVMPYNNNSRGDFSICAFDTSAGVMPAVAVGASGTCTPATTAVIDSAWKYAWVPLKDASGNIVAEVYPNGNLLGNTTASFYINGGAVRRDGSGTYYLDRNITITPATQPTSAVGTRLYFKNTELTTFAAAAGATTRSQLNVTKTTQTCAASAVATAGGVLLTQSSSAAYGTDNYVEVSNPSFSTFYLHKGTTALPIKFEYLTGKKVGNTNALNWKVTCTSTSITIVLERSADARTFNHDVTSITATQARCGQPFDAVDAMPLNGISYYRLKLIDVDGKVSYSPIAAVMNGKAGAELVGIYPTVVKDQAYLSITSSRNTTMQFSISDITGKVVATISQAVSSGSSLLPVSTSKLASGVYNITGLLDGTRTQTLRFVKE